ncbi:isopropanol dehydrogenase [Aspergillus filifer]
MAATHKALVLHSNDTPLKLETLPRPTASTGDAIVRILAADIVPYMGEVLDGRRPYPLSLPMTPGNTAIGRIDSVGPDSVSLQPGQLVLCDITIRARDNPAVSILYGIHGGGYPAAQKLMDNVWRNGTYAEYARFPLENLYPLNEELLLGSNKLGYTINDLCLMPVCLVPFGGLSEVDVKPGEVVIVAPATGRLRTVRLIGDAAADTAAFRAAAGKPDGADVYIDFSPPAAEGSGLLALGVSALRPFGRCVVMGGMSGDIRFPYLEIMFKSIRIQGRFMYDRKHVVQFLRMVEAGLLPLGDKAGVVHTEEFGLEEIGQALEAAAKLTGWGSHVVLKP